MPTKYYRVNRERYSNTLAATGRLHMGLLFHPDLSQGAHGEYGVIEYDDFVHGPRVIDADWLATQSCDPPEDHQRFCEELAAVGYLLPLSPAEAATYARECALREKGGAA